MILCIFTHKVVCINVIRNTFGMERDAMQELKSWKKKPGRKPLIIRGARQVGKTW